MPHGSSGPVQEPKSASIKVKGEKNNRDIIRMSKLEKAGSLWAIAQTTLALVVAWGEYPEI